LFRLFESWLLLIGVWEGVEDEEGEEEEGKGRWKDGWMDGVGIKWERKGGMRERNEKKRRKKARK
jgi:hypothetical protein